VRQEGVPAVALLLVRHGRLRAHAIYDADSYADYEVALVAATWSLLALEAALYLCLGVQGRQELGTLLQRAQQVGLIDAEEFAVLDAVRVLRNTIVHGALRPSFPPAAAVEAGDTLHQAVSDAYVRASKAQGIR